MIKPMTLESLLVTRDHQVIGVLRPAMEKLSIEVEVCRGARSGNEILQSEKFDAVIVDCDDLDGGLDLLQGLRKSLSNKNSVSFAILNGSTTTQAAFDMGAKFVLQKPISQVNATRCFSAALSFMVRERRRYFRHPVEITVHLEFGQHKLRATATNLSDGGMAVHFSGKLPEGGLSTASFSLPDENTVIEAKATLAWVDGAGRAGVRFVELSASARQLLDGWLTEQMTKIGLPPEGAGISCNDYPEPAPSPTRLTNPT
jgi:ActR/RegA family two-component response regulator